MGISNCHVDLRNPVFGKRRDRIAYDYSEVKLLRNMIATHLWMFSGNLHGLVF
jgi:hypothetical protein